MQSDRQISSVRCRQLFSPDKPMDEHALTEQHQIRYEKYICTCPIQHYFTVCWKHDKELIQTHSQINKSRTLQKECIMTACMKVIVAAQI